MADTAIRGVSVPAVGKRMTLRKFARRRSMVAFFLALPLIILILALVIYPFVWLILLPFRILGIAVHGVLALIAAVILFPARLLSVPFRLHA